MLFDFRFRFLYLKHLEIAKGPFGKALLEALPFRLFANKEDDRIGLKYWIDLHVIVGSYE